METVDPVRIFGLLLICVSVINCVRLFKGKENG